MKRFHQKIDGKYILVVAIAVVSSWLLHEFFHWMTGNILGYKMEMTLNKSFPVSGNFKSESDYAIVSAAGPVITIIEAIAFFYITKQKERILFYPFLFVCFYMRLFATVISVRHLNDEARISSFLKIGTFTLPLLVSALLFFLVYKISKQFSLSLKFNLLNLLLVIFFSSIIIVVDQFFHIRLL